AGMVRVFRIEAHLGKKQRRHEIRCGAAAGRMAAGGFRRRPHRVDAKTCGDVLQGMDKNGAVQGTSQTSSECRRRTTRLSRALQPFLDGETIRRAVDAELLVDTAE